MHCWTCSKERLRLWNLSPLLPIMIMMYHRVKHLIQADVETLRKDKDISACCLDHAHRSFPGFDDQLPLYSLNPRSRYQQTVVNGISFNISYRKIFWVGWVLQGRHCRRYLREIGRLDTYAAVLYLDSDTNERIGPWWKKRSIMLVQFSNLDWWSQFGIIRQLWRNTSTYYINRPPHLWPSSNELLFRNREADALSSLALKSMVRCCLKR